MNSVLSIYSMVYMLSAIVPLVAILFAWSRRQAPGAPWLLMLLLASAQWILSTAIGWANIEVSQRILASKLSYLGATMSPVFLLCFALEYTGRVKKVSPSQVAQLLVLPIGAAFAAATNESHNLIWLSVTPSPDMPDLLVYSHGPLYWLVTVYGLVITIAATVVLVGFALRARRVYRNQSAAVITAALIPWAAHVVYSAQPEALVWFDPGMTVGFSAAILTFSILRYRLLDLVPVARDALVEQMPDGMLVTDMQGRVVDVNPSAKTMLRVTEKTAVGKTLDEALPHWPSVAQQLESSIPGASRFVATAPWDMHVAVRTWPIRESNREPVGMAVLLSDVTAQVRAEKIIVQAKGRLDAWAGELQDIETGLKGVRARQ